MRKRESERALDSTRSTTTRLHRRVERRYIGCVYLGFYVVQETLKRIAVGKSKAKSRQLYFVRGLGVHHVVVYRLGLLEEKNNRRVVVAALDDDRFSLSKALLYFFKEILYHLSTRLDSTSSTLPVPPSRGDVHHLDDRLRIYLVDFPGVGCLPSTYSWPVLLTDIIQEKMQVLKSVLIARLVPFYSRNDNGDI